MESLRYKRGSLSVIDQLKLPHELEYVDIVNSQDAWGVIRSMQVRGAPLIAIVAALGLAVELERSRATFTEVGTTAAFMLERMVHLRTSRPTAVNLFVATDELTKLVHRLSTEPDATVTSLLDGFISAAEKMLEDDIAANRSIGDFGAKKILEISGRSKIRVLTICNTGSLATAGYGTALGVVRALHEMGKLEHVYACETRPYNQGARLTAFEIVQDGLPGTLIADSMASYLMSVKGVDCVVVGADRVAGNGDTANKIGTFQLAIAAKYHGIPFFAAVPTTTLDLTMASGAEIHVEERPAIEMTSIFNQRIAPEGINVWNPSFDVTPSSLIRGVITELGVAESKDPTNGIIRMADFLKSVGLEARCHGAVTPIETPTGFTKLDENAIGHYLTNLEITRSLLGTSASHELKVAEVGDGNLNFVYLVEGPNGRKLVVKQALPYIRCIGESWPMTLERASFEYQALVAEKKLCDEHVPKVYYFDPKNAVIVMEFVEAPHQILRKCFMQGMKITTFAKDLGQFLAKTLFGTSAIALDGGSLRSNVANWSRNTAMCALTEQVIFTDPYKVAPMNHWTTPQLDAYAADIRNDGELKMAAAALKLAFLTNTQCLLHADLHSGSVMVKEGSTMVIDPEFAFYGPMGFDIGALVSNMLLAYFSHAANQGDSYAEFLLEQLVILYQTFHDNFLSLWNEHHTTGNNSSTAYPSEVFPGDAIRPIQEAFLQQIWWDTLGFSGMKMIRRIVGVAHVADLESIENADARSVCEKRCLIFGRQLVIASLHRNAESLSNLQGLVKVARSIYSSVPPANLV